MNRAAGFTLIEMVMVIALIGVLAIIVGGIIAKPIEGYLGLTRRAELVDQAENALRRMTRELRLALPNSVRVSGGNAVEFLRTLDGGRYRRESDGSDMDACGALDDRMDFSLANDCFEVLGTLVNAGDIDTGGTSQADCMGAAAPADCLVIYNTGQPGANAYAGDNIAAIQAVTATSLTFNNGAGPVFPLRSPNQRFHVVDTPVSFVCAGGAITRYAGYAITAVQGNPPAGAPRADPLADKVAACSFSYNPGTSTRGGIVTLSVTLSDAGESITLMQQAHVPNLP